MSLHQQALRNKMAAGGDGSNGSSSTAGGPGGADAVMAEQQEKINKLYGGLPKKTVVNRAPTNARKYFDSGDYAMAKAGKTSEQNVGTTVPSPAMIPHVNSPSVVSQTLSSSPSASPIAVAVSDVTGPSSSAIAEVTKSPPSASSAEAEQHQRAEEAGVPNHTQGPDIGQAKDSLTKELHDAKGLDDK